MTAEIARPVSPADRRRLWALGACGLCLGAAVVSFDLLYLFVPPGWTPLHGFAPTIRAAYTPLLSLPDVILTTKQVARISFALQAGMWAAFLASVYLVTKLRDGPGEKAAFKLVIAAAAATSVALILAPPTLSPDLYHYALFGRMIITRGLNPYVTPGSALADDPLAALASWPDYPTHYGPVFTGLSVVAAWIGSGGAIGTAIAFKALATAGGVLAAWSVVALARQDGRGGLLPLLLVAWNPLALVETAASGHNEMVMIGLALVGVLVARQGRTNAGFLLLLASVHVKWITAALAGLVVLAQLRDIDGARARARQLGKLFAIAVAVTLVLYAPFWTGLGSITAARRLMVEPRTDVSKAGAISLANIILFAVVAVVATGVVIRRGRRVVLEMAAVVSLGFVTFMFPWVFPWYLLPAAALLAVGPPTRLNASLLIIVTAASMFLMAFWAVLVPR
jgi:alpha-1,6-mannosyltransferase